MSIISEPQTEVWTQHLLELANAEERQEQSNFSGQELVVQNYAFVLEACGAIAGKRVLDVGFGSGDLARMLDRLGGRVSAFDAVTTRIHRLREEAPSVAWWHGDISTWQQPHHAEPFDLIVACESLQYVEFHSALQRFLTVLANEGRLVILVPNADCPIVQEVGQRFPCPYQGVSMKNLEARLRQYLDQYHVTYRGIYFQSDQSHGPYVSGPWLRLGGGARSGPHFRAPHAPANRLQIVITRGT